MSVRDYLRRPPAPSKLDWPALFAEKASEVKDKRLRHFYQEGVIPSETPLDEVPFVAIDFETTGLNPHEDSRDP